MITHADVEAAAARIAGRVKRTPVYFAGPAWFKLEYLQHTGSFKARGAFNRVLAAQQRGEVSGTGIVIASGGNAGIAYAYAASELGVAATVFVPETSPGVKVARLESLGAKVVKHGSEYAVAAEAALEYAADSGAVHCHAYDQPEMAAGAGVVGTELLEQLAGEVDTIVVAVGGGGLMAGVAAAVEGSAKVIAVEPDSCPTLNAALAHGSPVDIAVSGIAADSLGARRLGEIAYAVAIRTDVSCVLVSDQDIADARRLLWTEHRIVTEPGAAAAYAAITSKSYVPADGERIAVVLCGANTDPSELATTSR